MKTKSRHEKHKHKKHKHKKEKLKKEKEKRKSSSSSESDSSEADEWVVAAKVEKRDEWMSKDGDGFDDFVPTYSRGGGERKRQRLEKSEAQKLLEKKLLQERELNPYWKNDGCGLPMKKPGVDDDAEDLKLPSQSVGDGGYAYLKKAYDRVRERAESEGRTMEQVAIERWGSLAKLESMLNDARRRMSGSDFSKPSGTQMYEKKYSDDYDKRNHRSGEDSNSSSNHSYYGHSDYRKHRKDEEPHRHCKNTYKDSRRSSSSSSDESHSHHDQRRGYKSSQESNYESKRFLTPKDDHREQRPAWKKKTSERESPSQDRRASPSRERRASPSRERRASPSRERRASPSRERRASPSRERRASPSRERRASPSRERRASPSHERRALPSHERRSSPSSERRFSPSSERRSSPSRERRASPSRERRASPSHERRVSPSRERRGSPSRERRGSPSRERRTSPSRESSHKGRFLPPKDDHREQCPAWKKRNSEQEPSSQDRQASPSYERKASPSRESSHEGKRFLPPKDNRREPYPAWKKKNFEEESLSREKGRETPDIALKSHRSSGSSRQPAWKKKTFVAESSLPEESFAKKQFESEEEDSGKMVPETEQVKVEAKEVKEESASSEEDSDEPSQEPKKDIVMNRNELNLLASRALRAELWHDYQLAEQIQENLDLAKVTRENFVKSGATIYDGLPREEIVSSAVDCYRLPKRFKESGGKWMRRDKVVHIGSFKKQYFDDHLSLKEMFQNEKMSTADDQLRMYVETAASIKNSVSEDFVDDVSGKLSKKMNNYNSEEKDIKQAIQDHKRHSNALDKCRFCLDRPLLLKHTIAAKGQHVFICLPSFTSLAEGHCFIIPQTHVSSSLVLEENEFNELQLFKRGLSKMFFDKGHSLIFMETSINHRYFPHAVIECIPMPSETADLAPMYFKKAIDECETEWAHNKKLIDLSKKDLRHSVPKGLQYFAVEFSFGGGFAHIVEDEKSFPKHFGKEIVGGMLEIDSYQILKAKDEPMKDVFKKVLKFTDEWWKYKNYFEY